MMMNIAIKDALEKIGLPGVIITKSKAVKSMPDIPSTYENSSKKRIDFHKKYLGMKKARKRSKYKGLGAKGECNIILCIRCARKG